MFRSIVYFAGAIRGDRVAAEAMIALVDFLKELGVSVPSEHVRTVDPVKYFDEKIGKGSKLSEEEIERQDTEWVNQATHLLAEVSGASTGTGIEISHARAHGKKILCLYRKDRELVVSAMVRGMTKKRYPNVSIKTYTSLDEAKAFVKEFIFV